MICYKKHGLLVAELWFDEEHLGMGGDVVRFRQRSEPVPGGLWDEKWSIQIDLTKDPQELLAGLKKAARYEARRALEKDKITSVTVSGEDPAAFARFCEYYRRFSTERGLAAVDTEYLQRYARASMLGFSSARSVAGVDLVWHSYVVCRGRARLLHSASLLRACADPNLRSLVSRANRFLHWQDMLHFKEHGCTLYDFGGWYRGQTDKGRLGINKFKEEFGGQVVRQYDCLLGVTIKGKFAMVLKRMLSRS